MWPGKPSNSIAWCLYHRMCYVYQRGILLYFIFLSTYLGYIRIFLKFHKSQSRSSYKKKILTKKSVIRSWISSGCFTPPKHISEALNLTTCIRRSSINRLHHPEAWCVFYLFTHVQTKVLNLFRMIRIMAMSSMSTLPYMPQLWYLRIKWFTAVSYRAVKWPMVKRGQMRPLEYFFLNFLLQSGNGQ